MRSHAARDICSGGSACAGMIEIECNSEKYLCKPGYDDELKDDIQQTLFVSSGTIIRILLWSVITTN